MPLGVQLPLSARLVVVRVHRGSKPQSQPPPGARTDLAASEEPKTAKRLDSLASFVGRWPN